MYGADDISPPFTYPATTYVVFRYNLILKIKGDIYLPQYAKSCYGTLINRRTVLTAGSCLPNSFTYSPSGFNNDTVTIPVQLNNYYHTWNSIYSIYFGIHWTMWFDGDVTPTTTEIIDKIIWVKQLRLLTIHYLLFFIIDTLI